MYGAEARQVMFFFFNDTATTEIYTLSLHDALPICSRGPGRGAATGNGARAGLRPGRTARVSGRLAQVSHPPPRVRRPRGDQDRKSTRLNSSHANISYAVFCLKKKINLVLLLRPCDY